MSYADLAAKLQRGETIILDGGTGTELERRGVEMDPHAWCGPATAANTHVLEEIHGDYIAAGADVITANTYACSPMMLAHAGLGDQFEPITRTAVSAAQTARAQSGRDDVVIAGSLSHMVPRPPGELLSDYAPTPPQEDMAAAFDSLARLIADAGCDVILAEMMYHPDRMRPALDAAAACGLPVWVGIAAKRSDDGRILSFAKHADIPLEDVVALLAGYDIAAAGIMHTPSDAVGDALGILRTVHRGPLMAYPDSGYFKMPRWQFEDVIAPADFAGFAHRWRQAGVQMIGGCCGLGPEHIAAIAALKSEGSAISA